MSPATISGQKVVPAAVGDEVRRLKRLFSEAGIENPETDADALVCAVLGWERARLHAHPEEPLSPDAALRLSALAERRRRREPLAYVLGEKEFWSLSFEVDRRVLVPRPETELLVERAVDCLGPAREAAVLDLGAGSGAAGVAISREVSGCHVTATDVDEEILEIAGRNARRHRVDNRMTFLRSSLFQDVPEGLKFDLIASNPPYLRSEEIEKLMPEVARYEPRLALDGGPDGMDCLRAIIRGAPERLLAGGVLLLEMDPGQIDSCKEEARRAGFFLEPKVYRDLAGRERVFEAVRR